MNDKTRVLEVAFLNDGSGKKYYTFSGNSSYTKPVNDLIAGGSVYIETDTGDAYFFDEESSDWVKVGGE